MSEWIDIRIKRPEHFEAVLVTDGKIVTAARLEYMNGQPWWWGGHGFGGWEWEYDFDARFDRGAITHWMPLPAPPAK